MREQPQRGAAPDARRQAPKHDSRVAATRFLPGFGLCLALFVIGAAAGVGMFLGPYEVQAFLSGEPSFNDTNVNKKGLSLNVRSAKGLEIAKRLIAVSDIGSEGRLAMKRSASPCG